MLIAFWAVKEICQFHYRQKQLNINPAVRVRRVGGAEMLSFYFLCRGMWAGWWSESVRTRWCSSHSIPTCSRCKKPTTGVHNTSEAHAHHSPMHSPKWFFNCSPSPSPRSCASPQSSCELLGSDGGSPEDFPSAACWPPSVCYHDAAWYRFCPDRGVSSSTRPHLPRLLHRNPWCHSPQF